MQTEVAWTCPIHQVRPKPFARHSKSGKKTRQTEKRWEDNIKEWSGLEFAKFQKAVENKEKRRKLVVQ